MGTVESWTGNIGDIGPIYPFVGTEFVFWLLGLALWIMWHVWQSRIENREYASQLEEYGNPEALSRVLEQDPESDHSEV
jgi:hypothetical protein